MTATRTATTPHPIYLAGRWVESDDPLVIENPARPDEPAGSTFHATPAQYEEAVEAAVRAFEVTRKLPAYERGRILREVSAGLKSRREELGATIAAEAGKPIRDALVEVDRADAHLPAGRRGGGADDGRADPARPDAGHARTGSGSPAASRSGRSRASARSTSRSTSPPTRSPRPSPRATRSSSSRRPRTRW